MNIVTHLQELDDLVVKNTKPPVTAVLRNKLAFCIEQAQARSADVERQEQTLTRQIKEIERLVKQNAQVNDQRLKAERDANQYKAVLTSSMNPRRHR